MKGDSVRRSFSLSLGDPPEGDNLLVQERGGDLSGELYESVRGGGV